MAHYQGYRKTEKKGKEDRHQGDWASFQGPGKKSETPPSVVQTHSEKTERKKLGGGGVF